MRATEIELPGIGEPETLRVRAPASCPTRDRARRSCASRPRACPSPSSRCGAASTTTSRSSRSCRATTSSGVVEATRARRVAALTKVGGWADRVVLDDADLVPVPDGLGPEAVETVIVNGADRLADAAPRARVRPATRSWCSAPRAASAPALVAARRATPASSVIGTAGPKQQERLRELGAIPIDYRAEDVPPVCARSRPTASPRSSTTSAAPGSTTRGGCSPAAARSSPTAPRRPRTSPATRAPPCSS